MDMTDSWIQADEETEVYGIRHKYVGGASNASSARFMRQDRTMNSSDSLVRWFHDTWSDKLKRYSSIPRNLFYSHLLCTDNIRLGADNIIKGVRGVRIGNSFRALDHLWLDAIEDDKHGQRYDPALVIGDNVVFGYCVHVAATHCVRIGNNVLVGSRVMITDHNHGIYRGDCQSNPWERPADRQLTGDAETIVEDNVWIGDGVVVLPGARIGRGSVIGANSVVNGVIPAECIAAGMPARPIKLYDRRSKLWVRAAKSPFPDASRGPEASS
jgi:acetyltransferase-like isoleucine patch superfamily enzyme